jgi:hypothetical protein
MSVSITIQFFKILPVPVLVCSSGTLVLSVLVGTVLVPVNGFQRVQTLKAGVLEKQPLVPQRQCCGSGSGRIRTFLVGSGSGRLGPDPVPDPGLNK